MKTLSYVLALIAILTLAGWIYQQNSQVEVIKVYGDGTLLIQQGNRIHFVTFQDRIRHTQVWP